MDEQLVEDDLDRGGGAAEVATHGVKATPPSEAYGDGLSRSLERVVLPPFFNWKQM
jgi:hypothetical protein